MENMYNEVLLCFQYCGYKQIENAKRLCEVLKENNIDFCAYIQNGYRPQFYVRRCGRKWNDIMGIVNKIYTPFYRKEKHSFKIVENLEIGIGNLQTYIICEI